MNFGKNLSQIRKSAGMSQEQLAEKLNITRQAISKWESGASFPDISIIENLCKIFNITSDQLIHGINSKNEKAFSKSNNIDIIYIAISVFTIVGFIAGVIILLCNFFSGTIIHGQITILALCVSGISIIIFIIATMLKILSKSKK